MWALNTKTQLWILNTKTFAALLWMNRWSSRVTASRRSDPKRSSVTEHSGAEHEQRQVLPSVWRHVDKVADQSDPESELKHFFCVLISRSTHLQRRTSPSCWTRRLRRSATLTGSLWTGCWASVGWRWEVWSLRVHRGWVQDPAAVVWSQSPVKRCPVLSDQTNADGANGEGERGTGTGGGRHHRPAGEHTHPRSVWPAGENLGPWSAAEAGQTPQTASARDL